MSSAPEEKELGNAAYKARDFAKAHEHYDKAILLDPDNITYLNNKAAVYLEEKKYDEVVRLMEAAVEKGREVRADYKLIARSLERAGKALHKQCKYDEAVKLLDKSLSEHRDQKVVDYRKAVDKEMKDAIRASQFDPAKAEEMKDKGNTHFKAGEWAEAKKCYDAAIVANPDDAKLYSNRAAVFAKLMAFDEAIRDCDRCLKLDPKFVKGYLRKGKYLAVTHEYTRATRAYEEAVKLDPACTEAQEGLKAMLMTNQGNPDEAQKRALENPEIQAILSDPGIRMILEQAQRDPKALQDHLKNPDIASKISKLIEAGVIGVR